MFVYNLKLSPNKILKFVFICVALFIFILFSISVYRVYSSSIVANKVNDIDTDTKTISAISSKNYTNILQTVHNNLDNYIGKQISFSGYIYRVYDFNKEQFVLARDMVISSDFQTVVVGFLCHYPEAYKFADKTWVTITGTITKGTYHTEIPIIEIKNIIQSEKPSDEYVYPPDDSYIPTSNTL